MLEEWSAAERRRATIVEILGAASNADAHHITRRRRRNGAIACMRLALADAGLEPGDVGHVNAMAPQHRSTMPPKPLPSPTSSGLQGADHLDERRHRSRPRRRSARSRRDAARDREPPHSADSRHQNGGPRFSIDLVLGEARPWTPAPSISNNFGFGGHNGSVVIGPVD
jgi:3-oxoacyl-[acyl-carrier-protein] synthase II